jgi:predicted dithiol-disulfide oxidoreductase (DUF899 family)
MGGLAELCGRFGRADPPEGNDLPASTLECVLKVGNYAATLTREVAMRNHPIVSPDEWLAARLRLLAKEKELTRQRDQLSEERRALPWVKVEKEFVFDGPNGRETLLQLFQGNSQLLIYHFMYGTDWNEGCKNCSFWADSFDGITAHLKHRDVTMIVVSRAPYAKLNAFHKRMGWRFKWVSSGTSDFNHDFNVSFTPEEMKGTVFYNYEQRKFPLSEAPGISVFYKDDAGAIFHTYSCYGRGLDAVNGAYQLLDLVPKGRNEAELPQPMSWVRHHDKYDDAPLAAPEAGVSA